MKKLIFCLMLFCFGYQGLVFSQDYDEQTKKALEAKYSYVFYDEDGNCFKVLLNGKYGICDLIGKEIIAPDKYTRVGTYGVEDGYYYVAIGDKEGILDLTGREIIAPDKYTRAFFMDMYGGYLAVEQNGKSGVCDLTGKEIVPCKYDNVVFHGEYYGVTLNKKEGACDLSGKEIVPCKYKNLIYSEGFKYKKLIGGWKLIKDSPIIEDIIVMASTSSSLSETEELTPVSSSSGSNVATSNVKVLTAQQREKCESDIEYNLEMANKGYGEAEYMLSYRFEAIDSYEETYKAYWAPYDSENPLVAAAYWLKKACEDNWEPAYNRYADYCYYGRGNAEGGVPEAIRWTEKAIELFPDDWSLQANIGFYYFLDNDASNNTLGAEYLQKATDNKDSNQDFFRTIGLALYYGITFTQNNEAAHLYFIKSMETDNYSTTFGQDTEPVFYLIHDFYYGIGCTKNLEIANELIEQLDEVASIEDVNKKLDEAKKKYEKETLLDLLLPF